METIIITFEDKTKKEYKKGITLKEIIEDNKHKFKYDINGGLIKGQQLSYEDSI